MSLQVRGQASAGTLCTRHLMVCTAIYMLRLPAQDMNVCRTLAERPLNARDGTVYRNKRTGHVPACRAHLLTVPAARQCTAAGPLLPAAGAPCRLQHRMRGLKTGNGQMTHLEGKSSAAGSHLLSVDQQNKKSLEDFALQIIPFRGMQTSHLLEHLCKPPGACRLRRCDCCSKVRNSPQTCQSSS